LTIKTDIEIFKLYINDGSLTSIENFKAELDEYIEDFRNSYWHSEIPFVAPIYEKYFTRYFLNKATNSKIAIEANYEYIQELFVLSFIRSLSPIVERDVPIIMSYMTVKSQEKFIQFRSNYESIYPNLVSLTQEYERTANPDLYNNIIVLRNQLTEYYVDLFSEYFTSNIHKEIGGYNKMYIRYVSYYP
jgi:hypothetical protein